MATSILAPETFGAARHFMPLTFSTTDHVEVQGIRAEYELIITGDGKVGDEIDFGFNDTSAGFSFCSQVDFLADVTGTKIPIIGPESIGAYTQSKVLPALLRHTELSRAYNITLLLNSPSEGRILFQARVKGSTFNLSLIHSSEPLETLFVLTQTVTGVNEERTKGFAFVADFFEHESPNQALGSLRSVPISLTDDPTPTATGNVETSSFLRAALGLAIASPNIYTVLDTDLIYITTHAKEYDLRVGPEWGEFKPLGQAGTWYKGLWAIFAGVRGINPDNPYSLAPHTRAFGGQLFLTDQPRQKQTYKSAFEFLYWWCPTSGQTWQHVVTYNYVGGTTAEVTLNVSFGDPSKPGIYMICTGMANGILSSSPEPNLTIQSYSYKLRRTTIGQVYETEAMTYIVSQRLAEVNEQVFFDNGVGGVDALWLSGRREISEAYNRTTFQGIRNSNDGTDSPTDRPIERKGRRRLKLHTGHLPADHMPWLSRLFLAEKAWILVGESLYACNVVDKQRVLSKSTQDVYGDVIELEYAWGGEVL